MQDFLLFFMMRVVRQEQVAKRYCGCSVIADVQGQVRKSFEQHDLVNYALAYGREVGLIGL